MTKGKLGDCDRCMTPVPATTTMTFSFGVGTFQLKLCDSDADRFLDDMIRWSRLGTILDERPQTLRRPARDPKPATRGTVAWSMLEIPSVVATVPTEDETDDDSEIPIVVQPRASDENLPAGHEDWSFSDHAKERLVERGLTRQEALWCAMHPDPERVEPSSNKDYPDCMVHNRGPVRVVVNPTSKIIVTVMYRVHGEQEQEQQIA